MDSITSQSWKYDVFISFEAVEFADHLHTDLVINGIKTFQKELTRGEEMSQELLQGIEDSKISIIVLSKNYASSWRCLEELVTILQCKESKKQIVWPIFYKVHPVDIKNQSGSFGDAFANHESKFKDNMEKVLRWKRALTKAADLPGWHFLDEYKSTFIHNITQEILAQVVPNRTILNVAKTPVGIHSRMQDMEPILGIGVDDVRMIGVCGMGGIGKTTIAKAVYNSISHKFEGSCFLENVREKSRSLGGLVGLQETLVSDILGEKGLKVGNAAKGISVIKERLSHKRILLILDDVDQLEQLDNLVGGYDWFGLGSRIIITTRDQHLLSAHGVNLIYKVYELPFDAAFELFIWNAFQSNKLPNDDYADVVTEVVNYSRGLPLALTIVGSLLCGRSIDQWDSALDICRKIPHISIFDIVKVSFDALEASVKNVFLDIACFFNGEDKESVIKILEGVHHNLELSFEVLRENAFLHIDEANRVRVHDIVEEIGKEIVHQESSEPGRRSRLWLHDDVYHVLMENRGTKAIEGIKIKLPKPDEINLSADCFSNMKNLKLFINCNARLSEDVLHYLRNNLVFVDWTNLNMPHSIGPILADGLKHISAEWIFLLTGLCLEIFSLAFDQASSPRKPHYALYGMLLAIGAVLLCICELVHKGRREGVKLRRWGLLWWFHHPHSHYALFGTLPDFYGLIGGISQCICSTVQYVFYVRHSENPIKVSLWPAIFLICLAASRLGKKSRSTNEHND